LHRTYLNRNGGKADVANVRMALGTLEGGGAVRLQPHGKVLGVAEGIETALSASILHPGVPCWAALNANRLEVWEPPEGVTDVLIFADNDSNGVGQRAAFILNERLNRTITSQVVLPPVIGTDWADVLREKITETVQ